MCVLDLTLDLCCMVQFGHCIEKACYRPYRVPYALNLFFVARPLAFLLNTR